LLILLVNGLDLPVPTSTSFVSRPIISAITSS
jgi:hypothetical protein